MSTPPKAPTLTTWRTGTWPFRRGYWALVAQCPYAPANRPHVHYHGGGADPAEPAYGYRESDCGPGGIYMLDPVA